MGYNKIIWSYWSGDMDNITKKCINSWNKHTKGWEIIILNENTINKYNIIKPSNYDKLSHTTKSDIIRLSLLYNYGGLWLDASIMLNKNINWIEKYSDKSFYGLQHNNNNYIESWLLYVPNINNEQILLWLNTLNEILDTTPHNSHIAYTNKCTTKDNYYMIYQAFCYLVSTNKDFKQSYLSLRDNSCNHLFYNVFIPLSSHDKLIKFTKGGRIRYKYYRFPLVYLFISLGLTIILISMLSYYKNNSTHIFLQLFLLCTTLISIVIVYST
tara:strand:- start:39 stop:848 length:810 start_codon:yes stop_codon:yes gene_type:complete